MANEKRLIDAQKLFNDLADYWGIPKDWDGQIDQLCEDALCSIENAPTVDAVEVVHGRWETEMDDMGWLKHTCSICGYVKRTDIHVRLGWNYCPKCGAKMDGDGNGSL